MKPAIVCVMGAVVGIAGMLAVGCSETSKPHPQASSQPQPYIDDVSSQMHNTMIQPNGHINTSEIGR